MSPSSLHIRRQRPQTPSLRHNSNRSTPSLLRYASPSYQTSTANLRYSSVPSSNGWKDTNGPAPLKVSPARSSINLTPSGDIQQDPPLHPIQNNAIKDHQPCPLYYDYSEDFSSNKCAHPEILEQPPQFHVRKTIPEDRQVSADSHVAEDWKYSATEQGFDNPFQRVHSPKVDFPAPLEEPQFKHPSRSGHRNFERKTADDSRNNKFSEPPGPNFRVQIIQVPDEELSALSRSSAIENTDYPKSTINGISQRRGPSNYNEPGLASEDSDLPPAFYDASTSLILDHKGLAYDGSCSSSPPPSPAAPAEAKSCREQLNNLTVPPLPLVNHESAENSTKGNTTTRSQHPTVMAKLAIDLSNPGTQLKLDSPPSESPFLYHNDEQLLGAHLPSPRHELELQGPAQLYDGSLLCPSSCGSQESRRLSSQSADLEVNNYSNENPPKFRLKITRASDSILGTVRVNRMSADFKPLAALDLRDTRDLFTPSSGIDNIFRQVSKHLQVPKARPGSINTVIEWDQPPVLSSIPNQLSDNGASRLNLNKPQHLAVTANPSDVQSFFSDDSSHCDGRHNLRKRFSNLRARVVMPHAARNDAHSHDGACSSGDNNWRVGIGAQHPNSPAAKSADNLHDADTYANNSHPRRFKARMRARRVKERVSGWIRVAKSAIADRMKSGGLG